MAPLILTRGLVGFKLTQQILMTSPRSSLFFCALCFASIVSPLAVNATTYHLDAPKTLTISCPSLNTTIGHRVTGATISGNLQAPYYVQDSLGTVNGTTRTASITIGIGTSTTEFYIESGYTDSTSGVVIFHPSGGWFKSIIDNSGDTGATGNFNLNEQPQDANTGIEVNKDAGWVPYELQGYTTGNTSGGGGVGAGGGGTYTNGSGQDETIHYTLKDSTGAIVQQWTEFLPPNGTSTPNVTSQEAGGTLEYYTTGQALIDGAMRDSTSGTSTIGVNNPVTSQTQPTVITSTSAVVSASSPPPVTMAVRAANGNTTLTNTLEDQRNLEVRQEIQRLALIADHASSLAHTDALAIKGAVEDSSGGAASMAETNAKLDSIDAKLEGADPAFADAALPSDVDTIGAQAVSVQTGLFANLDALKTAIQGFANRAIPPVTGSQMPAPSFEFQGVTHTFNFNPYGDFIAAFRLMLLGAMLIWFSMAALQELKPY